VEGRKTKLGSSKQFEKYLKKSGNGYFKSADLSLPDKLTETSRPVRIPDQPG
jgi:hypothetical protein